LKKTPIVTDPNALERQKRLDKAVKCLDELIIIIMERIAARHRIDEEELASACQVEPENHDELPDGAEFDNF